VRRLPVPGRQTPRGGGGGDLNCTRGPRAKSILESEYVGGDDRGGGVGEGGDDDGGGVDGGVGERLRLVPARSASDVEIRHAAQIP
jgi:hypothetical protein